MTHHITKNEEDQLRKFIEELRNNRITYPHGVPFEPALQTIEKLLDHDEPTRLAEKGTFRSRK